MQFDFNRFSKIAATVYEEDNPYSLMECLGVFRCYFQTYEDFRGHPHPPIRAAQIAHIMSEMPYIVQEDRGGYEEDIDPEAYETVIRLHFKTEYRRCDYNINHFFSGRIRELRWYEMESGYE